MGQFMLRISCARQRTAASEDAEGVEEVVMDSFGEKSRVPHIRRELVASMVGESPRR